MASPVDQNAPFPIVGSTQTSEVPTNVTTEAPALEETTEAPVLSTESPTKSPATLAPSMEPSLATSASPSSSVATESPTLAASAAPSVGSTVSEVIPIGVNPPTSAPVMQSPAPTTSSPTLLPTVISVVPVPPPAPISPPVLAPVRPPVRPPVTTPAVTNTGSEGLEIPWLFIGAAGGGVIFLAAIIIAALVCCRRGSSQKSTTTSTSAEIHVQRQEDVSTLGEDYTISGSIPLGDLLQRQQQAISDDGEDVLSSFNGSTIDLDAATASNGPSLLGAMPTPVVSDSLPTYDVETGDSLTVHIPAGRLGMILDTTPDNRVVVHTIKPESVLQGTDVQVGDEILAVDQQDVTKMTVAQVSKLISLKARSKRTLTFRQRIVVKQIRDPLNCSSF